MADHAKADAAAEPFFRQYTRLVTEADVVAAMREQGEREFTPLLAIPTDQTTVIHPPSRWTIRDVVGHMIDTERVMSYRALRFARGDATPLPGFHQDPWAEHSNANRREMSDLLDEWASVRAATVALFASLPPEACTRSGVASKYTWSVDDLARVVVGHARHHLAIIAKRLSH